MLIKLGNSNKFKSLIYRNLSFLKIFFQFSKLTIVCLMSLKRWYLIWKNITICFFLLFGIHFVCFIYHYSWFPQSFRIRTLLLLNIFQINLKDYILLPLCLGFQWCLRLPICVSMKSQIGPEKIQLTGMCNHITTKKTLSLMQISLNSGSTIPSIYISFIGVLGSGLLS